MWMWSPPLLLTLVTFVKVRADSIDDCKPQQVHLSYGSKVTDMVVMWATEGQCTDTKVMYGTDYMKQDRQVPGEIRLFDNPRNQEGVQYMHRVEIRDLLPGTQYFYKPVSNYISTGPFGFKIPDTYTVPVATPAPAPAPAPDKASDDDDDDDNDDDDDDDSEDEWKAPESVDDGWNNETAQNITSTTTTPTPIKSIDDEEPEALASIDDEEPEVLASIDDGELTQEDKETKFTKQAGEVRFLILSDLASTSPQLPVLYDEVPSMEYAAILHTGNIAMNMSSQGGKNADTYFNRMEHAISRVPYMTAPGEAEMEDGLYAHYLHRLSMPQSEWPITVDKLWYSLDIGPVHIISFSTDVFYTSEGRYSLVQHDWLIQDLKKANLNRGAVPWVVAFGHEPIYCSYDDPRLPCNMKTTPVKQGLEDIFYYYGVDIVIQSYGKGYERSLPMYKGVTLNDNYTDPLGPVFIMNGGATQWEQAYNYTDPSPSWVANRITNHTAPSFGRLHVINATTAHFEQVSMDNARTILDTFVMTQATHGRFSTDSLSPNITAEINQEIIDEGGKPGEMNINEIGAKKDISSTLDELLNGENSPHIIIGAVVGSLVAIVLIVLLIRRNQRRKRVTRRWENMDINYGKKFYQKAPGEDDDDDNDFEIDMTYQEGTEPTRSLLTGD